MDAGGGGFVLSSEYIFLLRVVGILSRCAVKTTWNDSATW
jgi:hypothetical protein